MRRVKWVSFVVTVIWGLMLLAGCGSSQGADHNGKTGNSAGPAGASSKEPLVVNIGIQQSIWPILLAKQKGWFEEEFAKVGAKVNWVEFQSGPSYFEAIASNRLDFGRVGDLPVISGQAADVPFKEIAAASFGSKGNAILVKKDSPIKTIQDLKGKKIAFAKASSAQTVVYKALEKANLKPADVQIISLQPDEAQPAFETGSVDAWAIWEPFMSTQKVLNGARVLVDGTALDAKGAGFQIVRTKFAEEHPDLVTLYLKVEEKTQQWQKQHLEEAIDVYAQLKKVDREIIRQVIENTEPTNMPITDEIIKIQQETANSIYEQGAIKKKIDTSKVVDNQYITKALEQYKAEQK
ncbi:aliphatic sulfonate ABC transporter substrate-binding protein [Paenibacillus sp. OAS669]|uniref:aliphatic sulfonate ABC transporter substrate-binding protein n=1 Tax=Paenibacillus sp. OAS669 TaxID=2663821 RepID=UPI00178AE060|nr:aliphatic sulfonate ABC transporter substrate-binding protein [Paenibacillus sp. OAS669]MBE1444439.1 sulfonate transport system substrate-binding protein [Paenibacillus sp. OAS669]